ncbi:unnamed protein product [Bursaphelenchus okinawaensis]|uniref:Major facilitator superfamily (MFS) profile domain-containing protein n=1 Tax=Bursaphelenchus okinawaensis TaxID=465554 RepID=A0A811L0F4_9BILA|nr:unnamed protein product [Bursaphelenchus okinawaensis]CAG9113940.1 unnamed protein product [Bursaphelenchus okinawaensis]
MDYIHRGVNFMCMEVPMFIYMASSFIRMPVYQSMLYEKVCWRRYDVNSTIDCTNSTQIRFDTGIHEDYNRLFLTSSLCLLIPSLIFTILLGSLSDVWSSKKAMIIPFIGLILGDFNYIFQASFMDINPYFVVISDILFGIFGGYSAIISTMFSHSIKVTMFEDRSERVALLEGAIGLGATIGSFASGILRQATSYSVVFTINCFLHVLSVIYIIVAASDIPLMDNGEARTQMASIADGVRMRLKEYGNVITAHRESCLRMLIFATFLALSIELFSYSGVSDILFSFLLHRFAWTDREYGFFRSLSSALGCIMTLVGYPLLRKRADWSNASLAILGVLMKIIFLLTLAFSYNPVVTYLTVIPQSFMRFVASGLRAMIGQFVMDSEQGRIFALIAVVESISSIFATTIFNGLYPKTLKTFDGLVFVLTAVALLLPLVIIIGIRRKMKTAWADDEELERLRRE